MFFVLSLVTGFLVAFMIQLNGVLQDVVGGSAALLSIHLCGLTGSVLFFLAARRRLQGDPVKKSPVIFLAAGMLGTLVVYLASVIFSKGGVLLSLSGSLAGQTLAASIAEGFYSDDRERSSLLQRFLSPGLLIPGSILIGLKAGVGPLWILISWVPGIVLMIQQSMNARNTAHHGTPKTIVFNYVSALIIIIPLFFLTSGFGSDPGKMSGLLADINDLPWYVIAGGGLIGVFTTGMIAFLLLNAPALLVVLGIYAGELVGGIILDAVSGREFEIAKLIGIALIAAGLGAGRIGKGKLKST